MQSLKSENVRIIWRNNALLFALDGISSGLASIPLRLHSNPDVSYLSMMQRIRLVGGTLCDVHRTQPGSILNTTHSEPGRQDL